MSLTFSRPQELNNVVAFDEEAVTNFYKSAFDDLNIDREESQDLFDFFREHSPEVGALVATRAQAFKVGCEYLTDDKDTNVQLFRCINIIVHAFETVCLKPKEYHLHLAESVDLSMGLEAAVQHLWNLDANRLDPHEDYVINVQSGKKPYWKEDAAEDPLFTSVDRNVWKRPTYRAFHALLDNYSAEVGVEETVSNTERREISDFLNAILQTAPMQFCHQYCHAKDPDNIPSDLSGFKALLHKVWFEMYRRSRGGRLDSSGFEHVFIGEARDGDVTGFHNWIQFYLEEQRGKLDYRGYLKPKSKGDAHHNSNDHLLTLQFNWAGVEKFAGTFFVGVSPEFEMALYSMCFLIGEEENEVELDTGDDVFGLRYVVHAEFRVCCCLTFPCLQHQVLQDGP